MKNKIKVYFLLTLVIGVCVCLFYRGRLSIKLDEKYTGLTYDIISTNGGMYNGIVNRNGLIKLPWNPNRKPSMIKVLVEGEDIKPDGLWVSPPSGRYILYSDSYGWESARVFYMFGLKISETKSYRQPHTAPNPSGPVR
jgi:hypothetical protein